MKLDDFDGHLAGYHSSTSANHGLGLTSSIYLSYVISAPFKVKEFISVYWKHQIVTNSPRISPCQIKTDS
ncbi:unnamed protein product [Absidia cylindrospora]